MRLGKEAFLQERCKDAEEHIENGRKEATYPPVKRFFGKEKISGSTVEGEDGQLVYGQEEIAVSNISINCKGRTTV